MYISIDVVISHYMSFIRADNGHICWLTELGDAILWRCENCRLQVTSPDRNTAIRDATCHVALLDPDPPDNPERGPRSPIPWKNNKIKEYVEAENNMKKNFKCYSRGGGRKWGINGHAVFTRDLRFHGP